MRVYSRLSGGKILLAHAQQDGRKYQCRSDPGLVFLKLVGAMGLYPVQGAWRPSCLPLEGVRLYKYF
jgi:hypothetical protein